MISCLFWSIQRYCNTNDNRSIDKLKNWRTNPKLNTLKSSHKHHPPSKLQRKEKGNDHSVSPADLWKKCSIRRTPGGSGFSSPCEDEGLVWSDKGRTGGWEGIGRESRRKSAVGGCLLAAILMWSVLMVLRFLSRATCMDFSVRKWRKRSVEREMRKIASEFTLMISLSSFTIFLTLPNGNAEQRIGSSSFPSSIVAEREKARETVFFWRWWVEFSGLLSSFEFIGYESTLIGVRRTVCVFHRLKKHLTNMFTWDGWHIF